MPPLQPISRPVAPVQKNNSPRRAPAMCVRLARARQSVSKPILLPLLSDEEQGALQCDLLPGCKHSRALLAYLNRGLPRWYITDPHPSHLLKQRHAWKRPGQHVAGLRRIVMHSKDPSPWVGRQRRYLHPLQSVRVHESKAG